jgi:hypothetical protein
LLYILEIANFGERGRLIMFKHGIEGESAGLARNRTAQNPIFISLFLLALAAAPVHAWTMYYDGFAYEPPSTDTGTPNPVAFPGCATSGGYRLPQAAPCGDGKPFQYPYHVGDTRYYNNVNTTTPLAAQFIYSPSAWVASSSGTAASGYWPFISPGLSGVTGIPDDPAGGFSYTGMPAPTGHVVVCFGSANNNGKGSRVSPINLNLVPPNDPTKLRAFVRGTFYYSLLMKVIEAPRSLATVPVHHADQPPADTELLGTGYFHAGFNSDPPDATLPNASTNTPNISLAGARLRLRAGSATVDNTFQVGIESDTGDDTTTVWDRNNTYTSGLSSSVHLVVVSYQFVNGTTSDDISSIWIDPPQASLGGASPPTYNTNGTNFPMTSTGGDLGRGSAGTGTIQIRSFFIREGGNAQGTITSNPPAGHVIGEPLTEGVQRVVFDEVRTGTSWADVTSDVACVAPTVGSISPAFGAKNSTLTGVAITGTNFVQGVTLVRLTAPSQPDIVATAVDVSDSSHLTCTFNIPNTAVLGNRDVVVTTCLDSPATLANGFHVVCGSAADFNCDGFVDGVDLVSFFETCAASGSAGAGVPFAAGCDAEDLDHDGDVDANDFGIFQRCYRGSSVMADPACGY